MLPTAAAESSCSSTESNGASHPGSTSVSLLRNNTYRPRAALAPWLQAVAKPRFRALTNGRTRPEDSLSNSRSHSEVPSVEPLSTTMISYAMPEVCSSRELRQRRVMSNRLKTGITIETTGASVRVGVPGAAASSRARASDGCEVDPGVTGGDCLRNQRRFSIKPCWVKWCHPDCRRPCRTASATSGWQAR